MAGNPGIAFVVSYPCPHCRAPLEGWIHDPIDWLRCPRCGRPSQPELPAKPVPPQSDPVDPYFDPNSQDPVPGPRLMPPILVDLPSRPTAPPIIALRAALFVAGTLLSIATIERSVAATALFGAVTVAIVIGLTVHKQGPR